MQSRRKTYSQFHCQQILMLHKLFEWITLTHEINASVAPPTAWIFGPSNSAFRNSLHIISTNKLSKSRSEGRRWILREARNVEHPKEINLKTNFSLWLCVCVCFLFVCASLAALEAKSGFFCIHNMGQQNTAWALALKRFKIHTMNKTIVETDKSYEWKW